MSRLRQDEASLWRPLSKQASQEEPLDGWGPSESFAPPPEAAWTVGAVQELSSSSALASASPGAPSIPHLERFGSALASPARLPAHVSSAFSIWGPKHPLSRSWSDPCCSRPQVSPWEAAVRGGTSSPKAKPSPTTGRFASGSRQPDTTFGPLGKQAAPPPSRKAGRPKPNPNLFAGELTRPLSSPPPEWLSTKLGEDVSPSLPAPPVSPAPRDRPRTHKSVVLGSDLPSWPRSLLPPLAALYTSVFGDTSAGEFFKDVVPVLYVTVAPILCVCLRGPKDGAEAGAPPSRLRGPSLGRRAVRRAAIDLMAVRAEVRMVRAASSNKLPVGGGKALGMQAEAAVPSE